MWTWGGGGVGIELEWTSWEFLWRLGIGENFCKEQTPGSSQIGNQIDCCRNGSNTLKHALLIKLHESAGLEPPVVPRRPMV